ncbi:chorismate mutase [Erythrobacter sp. HKB08]|uniref:chorismate mutase n=1 Tax=Erythrobacter sp. HKB08 TaxID=2502843 RepID=UPI001008890D|nr:chorismate mutase [Erythrobacter sp. HKB08]
MTDRVKLPEDCENMSEVRAGVDRTDQQIMDLLEKRFGYMRAAARIKAERGAVRDEARKAAVIAAVRERAERDGLPAAEIERIWEQLVEASIAYELVEWDRLRA